MPKAVTPEAQHARKSLMIHVRGVLVLLHLVAITLMAMPSPSGGMVRSAWKDPTIQQELENWSQKLQSVGLDWGPAQLEDRLWTFARSYLEVRRDVLKPFNPYYRYFGTWQPWRMFVAPHRFPSKLQVSIFEDGEWQILYEVGSKEYDWKGEQFDHDRMRSAMFRYAWKHYKSTFRQFSRHIAMDVIQAYPDGERVRVRYYKYSTPTPKQVREGETLDGTYRPSMVFQKEDLR